MFKRFAAALAVLMSVVLLWAVPASAARPEAAAARAPIPGCQTVDFNDSVPPFASTVVWQPAENGHDYGRYRISAGCGQQLNARLRGIGPDSNLREAIIFMHIQREDGTWYRTGTVHAHTGQGAVRVAGFLPVNRHFYLHCADAERDPQENQPCRLTFEF